MTRLSGDARGFSTAVTAPTARTGLVARGRGVGPNNPHSWLCPWGSSTWWSTTRSVRKRSWSLRLTL